MRDSANALHLDPERLSRIAARVSELIGASAAGTTTIGRYRATDGREREVQIRRGRRGCWEVCDRHNADEQPVGSSHAELERAVALAIGYRRERERAAIAVRTQRTAAVVAARRAALRQSAGGAVAFRRDSA